MKILIFEWAAGTFTYRDIAESFESEGIYYYTVSYQFSNKNEDEFFEYRFSKVLKDDKYDAVFSVNYFPLVAKCCHNNSVKYISWSYDNPLDVPDIENTLGYPENYVFLFDRIQADYYRNKGFDNIYHLPLAVNTTRLDRIRLTKKEEELYCSDVSFVGKMYDSMLNEYKSLMDDYCKGYIDALEASQSGIYGYWFIDKMLNDGIIDRINNHFVELEPSTLFTLPRDALSYAIAASITRSDRLILLSLLAKSMHVNVYSWDKCDFLSNVHYMGTCDYYDQMPKVFKASKINLNITLKIIQSGIPLRVMDILGSGGFLLTNYQPEIAEFFSDGVDVVMYDSIEDAYEKALFYIGNGNKRQEIAQNGHDKVKELFSYDRQLKRIFETAEII